MSGSQIVAGTFLILVKIPFRSWAAVAGTGIAVLAIVWLFVLQPYQKSRILDVADPGRDPLASGYQANQSRSRSTKDFRAGCTSSPSSLPSSSTSCRALDVSCVGTSTATSTR